MTATLDTSPCPVPGWLPDRQSQTLFGALFAATRRPWFVRERVDTPDGDFLDFDWTIQGLAQPTSGLVRRDDPTTVPGGAARWITQNDQAHRASLGPVQALILFHGLEGSSRSRYALSIARWHAVGVSLGGNALLKFLGEHPACAPWLAAAAGVSVPLDLVAAGLHLSSDPFNRHVYSRYFLKTLKPKVIEKANRFPGTIDVFRVAQAQDLRDFDDAYTAPMHGFRDALDYWTHCASKPWLPHIATPTLVLNARNDPFMPEPALPGPDQASANVVMHQPAQGGHVGFVTGPFPGHLGWLPSRLEQFFSAQR